MVPEKSAEGEGEIYLLDILPDIRKRFSANVIKGLTSGNLLHYCKPSSLTAFFKCAHSPSMCLKSSPSLTRLEMSIVCAIYAYLATELGKMKGSSTEHKRQRAIDIAAEKVAADFWASHFCQLLIHHFPPEQPAHRLHDFYAEFSCRFVTNVQATDFQPLPGHTHHSLHPSTDHFARGSICLLIYHDILDKESHREILQNPFEYINEIALPLVASKASSGNLLQRTKVESLFGNSSVVSSFHLNRRILQENPAKGASNEDKPRSKRLYETQTLLGVIELNLSPMAILSWELGKKPLARVLTAPEKVSQQRDSGFLAQIRRIATA